MDGERGALPRQACRALTGLVVSTAALAQQADPPSTPPVFETAEQCIACHSNLRDAQGRDVSIGHEWRGTMMAHAAKDPYWQAAVRREIMDQPELQAEIEDTCSTCHMPMARTAARAEGRSGRVFAHLGSSAALPTESLLALDGVSCTACHQIRPDHFGEEESFDGGYRITGSASDAPPIFGPFDDVDAGLQEIMESATGFSPAVGAHVQESELCATCHTLFTTALDDSGHEVGRLPEQVPYLEWRHSSYRGNRSCQDCHMPTAAEAPISSVLGEAREGLSRHAFRGGNVFMLRLLDLYRDELLVTAPAAELKRSAEDTLAHLQNSTAAIERFDIRFHDDAVVVDLALRNLAGHKLPTAYPSRRAWIHLTVKDQHGATHFETGALQADGSIAGNDNDADPLAFEPHHEQIDDPGEVQIYESIIVDHRGNVTTALLRGVRYVKDNRLLPTGFDKSTAPTDVTVQGRAADDPDFLAAGDSIRYRVAVEPSVDEVTVTVRLMFQTIGYRWARNLAAYDAQETNRFVRYYGANAAHSAVVLAEAEQLTRRP